MPRAPLPSAVQRLLNRTLLATFRPMPAPSSLSASLVLHKAVRDTVAQQGRIIHYRQAMCPVSKQRLEKLHVLIEDLGRPAEDVPADTALDVVLKEQQVAARADLTPLECALVDRFGADEALRLVTATRSHDKIASLKYLDFA